MTRTWRNGPGQLGEGFKRMSEYLSGMTAFSSTIRRRSILCGIG
jgi:hypothetical protein